MYKGQQFAVKPVRSRPPQLAVNTYTQRSIAEQLQGLSISTPQLKLKLTPITSTAQGAPVPTQQACPVGSAHAAAAAAAAVPPHTPTQTKSSRMGQLAGLPARGAAAGEKRDRASGREDSLLLAALGGGSSSRSDSQGMAPKRRVLLPAEHEQFRGCSAGDTGDG